MRRRRAVVASLAAMTLAAAGFGALPAPADPASASTVSASVGDTPQGSAIKPGFVGVSLEFNAIRAYTGSDPTHINPVLVHLLQALAPGQAPVIRIGGNSADRTWWPIRGTIPPAGVSYALTAGWLRTTHALARALGAKLIVGVNLAAGRPAIAATEARNLLQGLGRRYVQAIEVGNEPDVYTEFPWYYGKSGISYYARGSDYNMDLFTQDFSHWAAALPSIPLAGPAFAQTTWLGGLGQFVQAEPKLHIVTMHRYPLRACVTDPIQAGYPSIPALLDDASSSGLASALAPYIKTAQDAGLPVRVGEMNSASCRGRRGVSDTFAASLWVLDTLFNFAGLGVDGVNLHSLPGAPYELFTFKQSHGRWQAFVHPEYYGMLMFAQAFPPGAQLLPVNAPSGPVKVWATRSDSGRTRVVLINKSLTATAGVQLQVPASGGHASLEWLRAPSATSTRNVTLGGQTLGTASTTGTLGKAKLQAIQATQGAYAINLPPASAVLLTQ